MNRKFNNSENNCRDVVRWHNLIHLAKRSRRRWAREWDDKLALENRTHKHPGSNQYRQSYLTMIRWFTFTLPSPRYQSLIEILPASLRGNRARILIISDPPTVCQITMAAASDTAKTCLLLNVKVKSCQLMDILRSELSSSFGVQTSIKSK